MKIVILGGGLSGLLMAQRLRRDYPSMELKIIDSGLKTVHPFHLHRPIDLQGLSDLKSEKFRVQVWDGTSLKDTPSIKDVNDYSFKTFGHLQITNINNAEHQEIYPIDKETAKTALHKDLDPAMFIDGRVFSIMREDEDAHRIIFYETEDGQREMEYDYLISTIPLPDLLSLSCVDYASKGIEFESFPFYTAMIDLGYSTNLYQMIYCTHQGSITRLTLLNDKLFIETEVGHYVEEDIDLIYALYGSNARDKLPQLKQIKPGRIRKLKPSTRKPLIHWLTEVNNIFCLGRFGCWNFKVTNDVWDDTKFISNLLYSKLQARRYEGVKG